MSPLTHKIHSFRKLREKYSTLRERAVSERDTAGFDRTREWVVGHTELKAITKGVADGTIMRSIEGSDWGNGDSDWETLNTTEPDSNELDIYDDRYYEGYQKDEADSTHAVIQVVNKDESQPEKDVLNMEWETAFKGCFEGEVRESEEVADATLGEGVELSDLLELEKEQPDDFSNPEAPTRPTSPKEDNTSSFSDKMSVDFNYFDWSDEDEDDSDKFPETDFSSTEAAISDAEWALELLLPFKKYRAKTPTLLRACCTIKV